MENASKECRSYNDIEAAFGRYLGEPSADNKKSIVQAAEGIVRYYAYLYCGGQAPDDLIQAGYEGLLKSINKYDPERNTKFITFAVYYISGEMRHHLRSEASFDRPKWVADLQNKIYRSIDEFTQVNERIPEMHEIAAVVNIREAGVRQALRSRWTSLEEMDLSEVKHLRYESFQLPIEDQILVRQAMENLSELQKKVLYLTYYSDLTQAEVGDTLGIGQRKVSRVLKRGLEKMALYLA
ncbi:MAG: sigma-70 family RNA polymerase sigma factor [Ignavibacteriales bacterium]